jgi:flagellar hook-length control protein FliK
MNPNSTALSSLSNVSLRANSSTGNSTAAPASATSGTSVAPGSTEFSRMLASNQASARQASARQNNAVAQGKLTVASKTPDAPVQPNARQASTSANGSANASANSSESASEQEPQAMNEAAEPSATQTSARSERDAPTSADARGKAHDESSSAEASDAHDAEPIETAQSVSSDAAALAVPVALYVPPTVSLAQAPQLPAADAAVTGDASAALQATTAAALSTQTLTQPAPAADAAVTGDASAALSTQTLTQPAPAAATSNDPALAQAAVSAQRAIVAAGQPAPATVNGKPAEAAKSTDRDGRDVSASSGLQAMLGDAFNAVSQTQTQTQTQTQVDTGAAAGTSISPSSAPQDTSRQDFSTLVPTGLPLAVASAAAAREGVAAAAAEASLAVLGRGALNENRSRTPAAFDAAQSGVFALPTAGAASAARGSELPAPVQANVPTPFAAPGFQQALGYQVSLLARDGIGQAELHLNPADMGPVSVQITMTGDQARVDFGADLAQTRQALEAGWAELASSLKDAGFTLSGGGVSDHARERQPSPGQGAAPPWTGGRERGEAEVPNVAPVVARRVNGAVDVYA